MAVTVGSCATPRSLRSHGITVWGVKLYAACPRKKDGVHTWRLERVLYTVTGRTVSKKTEVLAHEWAKKLGVPFIPHLVQNSRHSLAPLELLAMQGGSTLASTDPPGDTLTPLDSPLCDATTSTGRKCKNFAEDSFNGRHYCGIMSHKKQILGMSTEGEQELQEQAEEEALDEAKRAAESAVAHEGEVAAELKEAIEGGPLGDILPQEGTPPLDLSGVSPVAETAPVEAAEPEAAEPEAPVGQDPEKEGWAALAAHSGCPGCGGATLSFWGVVSADPDTRLQCTRCAMKTTLSGQRW